MGRFRSHSELLIISARSTESIVKKLKIEGDREPDRDRLKFNLGKTTDCPN